MLSQVFESHHQVGRYNPLMPGTAGLRNYDDTKRKWGFLLGVAKEGFR